MLRVYYRENKIIGHRIETASINVKLFDYILHQSSEHLFKLSQPKKSWRKLFGWPQDHFNFLCISKDDIDYNNNEHGHFYLPHALIFYDKNEPGYSIPSEVYYLSKLQDGLELRHLDCHIGTTWFESASLHTSVDNSFIIRKIENTLEQVKHLIETKYNIVSVKARQQEQYAETERKKLARPPLEEKKKISLPTINRSLLA